MAKAAVAPVEDTFEVVLPDGLTELELGEPSEEETAETAAPETPVPVAAGTPAVPAPAPPPPPASAPVTAPPPSQPPLHPAAREERRKRKHYQGLWQKTQAEVDELKRQDRARQPTGRFQFKPVILTAEAIAKMRQQADTAEGLGAAVELTVGQILQEVNAQISMLSEHVGQEQRAAILDERALWSEELARSRHEDYDAILEKSGIKADLAVVNGAYVNPHLARKILFSPNPGEYAYQLASDKLDEAAEGTELLPPGPGNGQLAAPPVAATPAPTPETEAERRGQARVLAAVTKGAERPKGIRALPSAGPPVTTRLSIEYLDQLQETNPDAYEALCAKNPGVNEFHLGGLTRGER